MIFSFIDDDRVVGTLYAITAFTAWGILPLFWFAKSAKKIPLSRIGFIQYLAPTFMLLLGVILYKEPFTRVHRISFGLIWTALALYSLSKTHLLARIESKYLKLLKEKTGL